MSTQKYLHFCSIYKDHFNLGNAAFISLWQLNSKTEHAVTQLTNAEHTATPVLMYSCTSPNYKPVLYNQVINKRVSLDIAQGSI